MESNADGVKKNSAEDHSMPILYLPRSGGGGPKTPNVPAFFHSAPFRLVARCQGQSSPRLTTGSLVISYESACQRHLTPLSSWAYTFAHRLELADS